MNSQEILAKHWPQTGWDTDSMLAIICEYVDNQGAEDAFADFVAEKAAEESTDQREWQTGDEVLVPDPIEGDGYSHSFVGNIVGFRNDNGNVLVSVEDGDGDVFDIEYSRLEDTE